MLSPSLFAPRPYWEPAKRLGCKRCKNIPQKHMYRTTFMWRSPSTLVYHRRERRRNDRRYQRCGVRTADVGSETTARYRSYSLVDYTGGRAAGCTTAPTTVFEYSKSWSTTRFTYYRIIQYSSAFIKYNLQLKSWYSIVFCQLENPNQ